MIADLVAVWDFLRDQQNREALLLLGGAFATLAVALWTLWRDWRGRRDLRREIAELRAEIATLRADQDGLRQRLENSDRTNQIVVVSPLRTIRRGPKRP